MARPLSTTAVAPYRPIPQAPNHRLDLISSLCLRNEGQFLSPLHFQSRLFSPSLGAAVSSSIQGWSLSPHRRIHSLDSCIESMDVHPSQSSRYLLTGSRDGYLSVYDLSYNGAEGEQWWYDQPSVSREPEQAQRRMLVHNAVARSNGTPTFEEYSSGSTRVRLGSVVCARWYPLDTGAFVSAHRAGSIVIWDTNEMTPVIRVNPFAYEGGTRVPSGPGRRAYTRQVASDESTTPKAMPLSCVDMSPAMPHLVATGSIRSALIKLVDIRTGAASHTLTGHGKAKGIASLQWSPTAPHVLASGCSAGTIRLWDIRKAGRNSWLLECLDPNQPAPSLFVSNAYYPDLSHLKQEQTPHTRTQQSSNTSNRSERAPVRTRGPNDYSTSTKTAMVQSHDLFVDALAFDPSGQFLVSHGQGDISLKTWDLRDYGQLIPHRHLISARKRCTTRLQVAQHSNNSDSTMIWFSQGTTLSAYNLHESGRAKFKLNGHLEDIRDFTVLPNDASLQGELLTAGADGLILTWEPNLDMTTRYTSGVTSRKRPRPSTDVDEDSW